MKRIYQLLLSFLFFTSGVIAAMDNQGQALMQAINRSDLPGVQNILSQGFINVCQKIGTQSPLEAACKLKDSNPVKDIILVSNALIGYAFDHVVEITTIPYAHYYDDPDMASFINLMVQCRMDQEETIRRILNTCAEQKNAERQLRCLLGRILTGQEYLIRTSADPLKAFYISKDFLKNCNDLLSHLIANYPSGMNGMDDAATIILWVFRCIQYGAPVNIPNKEGITALDLVVQQRDFYTDLVEVLLTHGADPTRKFTLNGKEYTAITFLEEAPSKDAPKQFALRYLKKELPLSQRFEFEESRSFATNFSKVFASYKTWAALACMYLGVKCYKRVTSGRAKYSHNMVINEAGSEITMTDDEGLETKISSSTNNTAELSKTNGSLAVKFSDTNKNTAKDLNINLDQYEDSLYDYFINITIRPTRWYEWLYTKTALTYCVSWKQKPKPQEPK